MSLRPFVRSIGALSRTTQAAASRSISTSAPRKAGHGHDDHHGDSSADSHETFFSPAMRNTIILTTLFVFAYPYLPDLPKGSASPSVSSEAFDKAASDSSTPLVTRLLAQYTPSAKTWSERNDKHLELSKEAAEDRLLFQEAERPRVWRLRNAR